MMSACDAPLHISVPPQFNEMDDCTRATFPAVALKLVVAVASAAGKGEPLTPLLALIR
jgi:hypothetical protein